ncbi:hypothetical protein HDU96_010938 [Phlyctochytrium bullatum]|nr:hypothetical protein HDU96_010938 [Phlyctochytrium bullatum]
MPDGSMPSHSDNTSQSSWDNLTDEIDNPMHREEPATSSTDGQPVEANQSPRTSTQPETREPASDGHGATHLTSASPPAATTARIEWFRTAADDVADKFDDPDFQKLISACERMLRMGHGQDLRHQPVRSGSARDAATNTDTAGPSNAGGAPERGPDSYHDEDGRLDAIASPDGRFIGNLFQEPSPSAFNHVPFSVFPAAVDVEAPVPASSSDPHSGPLEASATGTPPSDSTSPSNGTLPGASPAPAAGHDLSTAVHDILALLSGHAAPPTDTTPPIRGDLTTSDVFLIVHSPTGVTAPPQLHPFHSLVSFRSTRLAVLVTLAREAAAADAARVVVEITPPAPKAFRVCLDALYEVGEGGAGLEVGKRGLTEDVVGREFVGAWVNAEYLGFDALTKALQNSFPKIWRDVITRPEFALAFLPEASLDKLLFRTPPAPKAGDPSHPALNPILEPFDTLHCLMTWYANTLATDSTLRRSVREKAQKLIEVFVYRVAQPVLLERPDTRGAIRGARILAEWFNSELEGLWKNFSASSFSFGDGPDAVCVHN